MSTVDKLSRWPGVARVGIFLAVVSAAGAAELVPGKLGESAWVHPGADGKLAYKTTPSGDRIMDFSYAGYGGGGVALPEVPVRETVKPTGGADDTAAVQAAIDRVAALPMANGFRGAVLLAPGNFVCASPITISASGVVLRGSGAGGAAKSTLKLTGRPHNAITVRAPGGRTGAAEDAGAAKGNGRTTIADTYVPSGATSFAVKDATNFAVGDTILIQRPVTQAWVTFMAMHDLTRDGQPQTWLRPGTTTNTERRITAIAGNTLTLDVPLSDSFDAKYLNPPGPVVAKIAPSVRLTKVGIERLHIEAPPQEINHTEAHFTALRINGEDCWVRDVVADETMNSIAVGGRRITLERVIVNRKAKHQGASKPAEFAPNASEVLLDRCVVNAENVWFVATGAGVAGPIVILNSDFRGNGRAESHQRWSTGMLYDNCRAPEGGIEIRNRGAMGSGHGWSMGWGVIWNCVAKEFLVQNPPGAVNWIIGSVGHTAASPRPFGSGPNLAGGTEDAPGAPVAPRSLYLAQLEERLGAVALKNIGYESSAGVPPASEQKHAGTPALHQPAGLPRENLARDRPVLTSNTRDGKREFAGWQALDDDDSTYWATDDGTTRATLELDTEGALEINAVEIAEAVGHTGRVQAYRVEGFVESAWKLLAEGTTIGERKLHRFPPTIVWKVKLTIENASAAPAIRTFALYRENAALPSS